MPKFKKPDHVESKKVFDRFVSGESDKVDFQQRPKNIRGEHNKSHVQTENPVTVERKKVFDRFVGGESENPVTVESKKVFDRFVSGESEKVDFSSKPGAKEITDKFKHELHSRSGSSVSLDSEDEGKDNQEKPGL